MDAADSRLPPLHRAVLLQLLEGAESTLLLLEIVNNHRMRPSSTALASSYVEDQIASVLEELKALGLVKSVEQPVRLDHRVAIPEFQDGRRTLFWWSLTEQGRATARS